MVIVTRKFIFSLGEVWFDKEPEELSNVDVIYYMQRTQPIKYAHSHEFHTRLIDLTKSHDELWQNISKNCRSEIRRAEQKDEVVYEFWEHPNSDIIKRFSNFYDLFASQKGLNCIDRLELKKRADAGFIFISCVKSKDSEPLAWHCYYRSKNRIRILNGATIKNTKNTTDTSYYSMLGRAHRYHHWQDILTSKSLGIAIYDFGGWYTGNTDQEKLGINHFKEKFGGEIVKNFNCVRSITIKGKLYLHLKNLKNIYVPLVEWGKRSLLNS